MKRTVSAFLILAVAQGLAGGVLALAAPPSGAASSPDVLAIVEKALQKHGTEVHRCFEKALADRLDVAGKLEVEVVVGKGGKVSTSRIKRSEKALPLSMSTCVEKAAMGFTLEGMEPGATVLLPFSFKSQSGQYVVKSADVPDRGQAAGDKPGPKRTPPFTAKVLADENNVKVNSLSLTLLSVGPASRVAMHRHPGSAKVLFLLKGHARLLGLEGVAPVKIDEGSAVYVPAGFPHVIENMGRQTTALFLQAFSPPGPERVYRDPKDPRGRAAFEVIRDPAQVKSPQGASLVVMDGNSAALTLLPGTTIAQKILLGAKTPGMTGPEVALLELNEGTELSGKGGAKVEELYYVQAGAGQLKIAGESIAVEPDSLISIPAATSFVFKATPVEKGQKTTLLRFSNTLK